MRRVGLHEITRLPQYSAAPASGIPASQDLRLLSSASALSFWYRAENNVTLSPTLRVSGTATTQVLTISGNLNQTLGISVIPEPGDTTKFRWSARNGWDHWGGGQAIPFASAAAGYALGSTGITLTASQNSCNSDNRWDALAASWDSIVGSNAALTTMYGSVGPYVISRPLINPNGDTYRPALELRPSATAGYLTNEGAVPAMFAGSTNGWHTFDLMRLTSDNISTLAVAVWTCTSTASTTARYLQALMFGPLASGGARFALQRGPDGGGNGITSFAVPLDFHWFVHEHSCDGTATTSAITYLSNGITLPVAGGSTWNNGQMTSNRYMFGANKLGGNAVANQMFAMTVEKARYNRKLTAAEADDVRQRMIWG